MPIANVRGIWRTLAEADISQERMDAIVRQSLGLAGFLSAVFAVLQRPQPGLFMLYALFPLLGNLVSALERKGGVGRALFALAMLVPYVSLLLMGVPPIFAAGVRDGAAAAARLAGFMGCMAVSAAFLAAGFLYSVFAPAASLILEKRPLAAGGAALLPAALFTAVFAALLGSPGAAVAQSLVPAEMPDKTVSIRTTALAPDASGALTETSRFMSNEVVYAYAGGLAAGTRFGYRLADPSGNAALPFDRAKAAVAGGSGLDKYEAFNTAGARLSPGEYVLELIVARGWKAYVCARAPITVLADVNPNYGVQSTDPYCWLAKHSGGAATRFGPDDPIEAVLEGSRLQGDVHVMVRDAADRVVLDKTYGAMPIGQSRYAVADKASALGLGKFVAVISSQGKEDIVIYFTVQ